MVKKPLFILTPLALLLPLTIQAQPWSELRWPQPASGANWPSHMEYGREGADLERRSWEQRQGSTIHRDSGGWGQQRLAPQQELGRGGRTPGQRTWGSLSDEQRSSTGWGSAGQRNNRNTYQGSEYRVYLPGNPPPYGGVGMGGWSAPIYGGGGWPYGGFGSPYGWGGYGIPLPGFGLYGW